MDPDASSSRPLVDPRAVETREEFGRALTLLRERAGLTIRQVAVKAQAFGGHSTIGEWFAGRGLPSSASADLLVRVLEACGVTESQLREDWLAAWRRARRAPGPRPSGLEPYRGLASYRTEDAEWFFGREIAVGRLVDLVGRLRAQGGGQVLLVGASGAGKTSLLRAGLVPRLRADASLGSQNWTTVLLTPGRSPLAELQQLLAGLPRNDGGPPAPSQELGQRLVVLCDQVEELLTGQVDEAEADAFLQTLRAWAEHGAVVVLALRADFYGQALRHRALLDVARSCQLIVEAMGKDELRAAIEGPARMAKGEVEPGLVEVLLREVAPPARQTEAGSLPLLSHALWAAWRAGRGSRLSLENYRRVGGLSGAVAATAEYVYGTLNPRQQQLARRLITSLVHVGQDVADTRRHVAPDELLTQLGEPAGNEAREVLERFVAQRLVTVDRDRVTISHEALIAAWPRLRRWLDEDRADLLLERQIVEAASVWRQDNRDREALLRGTRLAAARLWAERRDPVPASIAAFLDASTAREREEARAARRRTRRLQQLVVGLAVLTLLATASTVVAVRALHQVSDQRDRALSAKVANQATTLRTSDPALAADLDLAAYRLAPTPEARGGLMSALAAPWATRLAAHAAPVYAAAFNAAGTLLATTSEDRTVRLYDVRDPHHRVPLGVGRAHADTVTDAAFDPGRPLLATAGADRTVRLWDTNDPAHLDVEAVLRGFGSDVRSVAIARSGRLLACADLSGAVTLWNITRADKPRRLSSIKLAPALTRVAFSPDGDQIAAAGGDARVRLVDVTHPYRPTISAVLIGHTGPTLAVAFSPNGRVVASGGFDNTVRLWDVSRPRAPRPLAALGGHTNGIIALAFSPDGRILASGGYDNMVRLWDVADPAAAAPLLTLPGHTDTVFSAMFSPDGRTLATSSADDTARLWDLRMPIAAEPAGPVHALAVSPDGRYLATGAYRVARLWEVSDPAHPVPLAVLRGHTDNVTAVAFLPRHHTLVTAGEDRLVRLWDVAHPARPGPLATITAHTQPVYTVAARRDGKVLATAGDDLDE